MFHVVKNAFQYFRTRSTAGVGIYRTVKLENWHLRDASFRTCHRFSQKWHQENIPRQFNFHISKNERNRSVLISFLPPWDFPSFRQTASYTLLRNELPANAKAINCTLLLWNIIPAHERPSSFPVHKRQLRLQGLNLLLLACDLVIISREGAVLHQDLLRSVSEESGTCNRNVYTYFRNVLYLRFMYPKPITRIVPENMYL